MFQNLFESIDHYISLCKVVLLIPVSLTTSATFILRSAKSTGKLQTIINYHHCVIKYLHDVLNAFIIAL